MSSELPKFVLRNGEFFEVIGRCDAPVYIARRLRDDWRMTVLVEDSEAIPGPERWSEELEESERRRERLAELLEKEQARTLRLLDKLDER